MANGEMKAALMKDLEAAVDQMLKAGEGGRRLTLSEIEAMVLEARQQVGQKMVERLVEDQEASQAYETPISEVSGKRLENKGKKKVTITTQLGSIQYQRTYYYDAAAGEGHSPFDDALGVTSSISTGATRMLVKLCARLPYEAAVQVYDEVGRVRIGVSTAWKRTQVIGQRARPALEPIATMKPTSAHATGLGISMDGCMAHVRTEGWKEVKVGVVFEVSVIREQIKTNHQGEVIPAVHAHQQSYVMHLGGPEGFGVKLATEAQSRRTTTLEQCCVVGDGAAWIWHLASHDYANAAHVVDWYHAQQHLCAASELLFPAAPERAQAWLAQHQDQLYAGQADAIADRLVLAAALAPPELKAKLETQAGYFADNVERMQYRDFQKAGVPIGSGTVESAAKQTKHRVAAAGMHWSRPGLENLLPLRAALMSDTFDALWHQIGPL